MKNKQIFRYQMFIFFVVGIIFLLPLEARAMTVQCKEKEDRKSYTCTITADEGYSLYIENDDNFDNYKEIEKNKVFELNFGYNPADAEIEIIYREIRPHQRYQIKQKDIITLEEAQVQEQKQQACDMYNRRGYEKGQKLKSAWENAVNKLALCSSLSACPVNQEENNIFTAGNEYINANNSLNEWIRDQENNLGENCTNFNTFKETIKDGVDKSKIDEALKKYNQEAQNSDSLTQDEKAKVNSMINKIVSSVYSTDFRNDFASDYDVNCDAYSDILDIVNTVFNWIQIGAPILLIIFGALDFGKAVINNDQDALKKATSNFTKRAIATVAIFFLPMIINLIFRMDGIKDLIANSAECTEEQRKNGECGICEITIKPITNE